MSRTLTDRAYRFIQKKLSTGELPAGSRLVNRTLATEIGTSVIPVREALRRLASEGFVEYLPGQGAYVTETSLRDIREMYDLREALECHAVSKACGNLSKSDLLKMREANDVMKEMAVVAIVVDQPGNRRVWRWKSSDQYKRWYQADRTFHGITLSGADNRRLHDVAKANQVVARSMLSCFHHEQSAAMPKKVCGEHDKIIAALKANDAESARQAMAEHIRLGMAAMIAAYGAGAVALDDGE